jgi:alpha-glucosidase
MSDTAPDWWKTAVFYQVYPRSFGDASGDGVGDLPGVTARLDYLRDLGVDALWLSPFYRSPMADHGYDVADPRDVDPVFGTLADFDALVAAAHERGIRITVDIVPNHFSDQHPWFQEALASPPGSPARARFIFREGRGEDGEEPPNNWPSVFGGSAWKRVPDGQWYLHLFAPEQPDLDWTNPEVVEDFRQTIRFWAARGADGFRIDVAHAMAKPEGLPDLDLSGYVVGLHQRLDDDLRFDQDGVHAFHRELRAVMDEVGAMAVGEIWVPDDRRLALYVRPDEIHLAFNFRLLEAPFEASAFRAEIDASRAALAEVGAPCTWVLSNHDVDRHATRYGGGEAGVQRARAAALLQLSLPGAVYLYQGDELGLENVDVPDEARTDPVWFRTGGLDKGRDGERVPMPWSGGPPAYGFSSSRETWLPMPAGWEGLTVEAQLADDASTLSLYRRALAARRATPGLGGDDFEWLDAPHGGLTYRRGAELVVASNLSDDPIERAPGEVLLASGPLDADGGLPPRTTVWLRG